MARLSLCLLLLLMAVVVAEAASQKPKQVKCQDKKYPNCYHKKLLCPDSCLRTCVVDCATCQPVCTPPSPPPPSPPPPPPKVQRKSPPPPRPKTNPSPPPPPSKQYPSPKPPPPTSTPPSLSPPPTTFPSPPPPSISTPSPPPPSMTTPPSSPSPPTPTTSTPPPWFPPPPPDSSEAAAKRVKCKNKYYPQCYDMELTCPSNCPSQCEVDCVTCSPVCNCNRPGAVCQDPRFIGGDGITFYFHGKKDRDFCLVSDSNLHINAHFIGRRNQNMKRDFTWVQSLGILFDTHKLFIGAKKTSTWDDSIDRLSLTFNEEPIFLPDGEGAVWQSVDLPRVTITRSQDTNAVEIEVEGNFKIKATVVPITEKDSRIHNYGITQEDCFAHLDVSFKFYALSGDVNGVLGQTYASNYVSRVKMGVIMPVLGGEKEFSSSSLFATDCSIARFSGQFTKGNSSEDFEFANLNCASGMDGRGVVCKR